MRNEPVSWYWIRPDCLYNGYRTMPEKDKPNFYLDCKVPAELFFTGVKAIGKERGEDGAVRLRFGFDEYHKVVAEECCGYVRVYAPPPHFRLTVAALATIGALFEAAREAGAESFYVQRPRYVDLQLLYYVFVDHQIAAELSLKQMMYAFTPDGKLVEGSPQLLVTIYYLGGNWRNAPHIPDWPMIVDGHLARVGAFGPYNWGFKDMPVEVVFSPSERRVVPLSAAPAPIQRILGTIVKKSRK